MATRYDERRPHTHTHTHSTDLTQRTVNNNREVIGLRVRRLATVIEWVCCLWETTELIVCRVSWATFATCMCSTSAETGNWTAPKHNSNWMFRDDQRIIDRQRSMSARLTVGPTVTSWLGVCCLSLSIISTYQRQSAENLLLLFTYLFKISSKGPISAN